MTGRAVAGRARAKSAAGQVERARDVVHLVLVTSRPAVQFFFAGLSEHSLRPLAITHARLELEALARHTRELERATTVVVDMGVEPEAATRVCRELHERWRGLPIVALLCCPQSVTPWNLRAMIASGVNAVLDLQSTPDETLRAVESVADGGTLLQLRRGHRALLRDVLAARGPKVETPARLLELVAHGLPDREIGRRLHLSPHTVKHHIESLRHEVGVRNRTELAAWAGRHGFYSPDRA